MPPRVGNDGDGEVGVWLFARVEGVLVHEFAHVEVDHPEGVDAVEGVKEVVENELDRHLEAGGDDDEQNHQPRRHQSYVEPALQVLYTFLQQIHHEKSHVSALIKCNPYD